jgi:CDGSH-type Zn-finger protein
MADPIAARKSPYDVELQAGKPYLWCACGRSTRQPFCDGASHKEFGIKPLSFTAEESKTYWLCACKQTKIPPICDGTHGKL